MSTPSVRYHATHLALTLRFIRCALSGAHISIIPDSSRLPESWRLSGKSGEKRQKRQEAHKRHQPASRPDHPCGGCLPVPSAPQCRGYGMLSPCRISEHCRFDSPVAAMSALSGTSRM